MFPREYPYDEEVEAQEGKKSLKQKKQETAG